MPPVSQTVRVTVLFFGQIKDLLGRAEDSAELREGATIDDLFAHFAASHSKFAAFRPSLVASRNQEFAAWDTPLKNGDEIAFIPPVSGG